MGIKGLTKLLQEKAEGSMKERDIKSYFGRKIAIDASMCLYQFLIAVRSNSVQGQLTNSFGDITSHIVGFFYRSIRMLENGIKPVYVFDGKPPIFKSGELKKRQEKREKAKIELKEAENNEDKQKQIQMEKRLVKVTKKEVNDIKKLLKLMGIPYIDAPGEAEAQCAYMVKNNIVYATATEDMDALTFGTNILLRHLTVSQSKKLPILEFNLNKILNELNMNMTQFIDLCILCGCDYTDNIKGIGPKKAFDAILKYKNIENFIKNLDNKKYKFDNNLFKFKEARNLFINPDVITINNNNNNNNNNDINNNIAKIDINNVNNNEISDDVKHNNNNNDVKNNNNANTNDNTNNVNNNNVNNNNNNNINNKNEDKINENNDTNNNNENSNENEEEFEKVTNLKLKWGKVETEKLIDYLVTHCNMAKDRVLNGIKRIEKSKVKSSQKRLDSFFKMKPNIISSSKKSKKNEKLTGNKRKKMDKNKENSKPKNKKLKK